MCKHSLEDCPFEQRQKGKCKYDHKPSEPKELCSYFRENCKNLESGKCKLAHKSEPKPRGECRYT
jgi:hypothetical protein